MFVFLILSLFFLIISKTYVNNTASFVLRNFVNQNKLEIVEQDTLAMASRLNSLSVHPDIKCLAGTIENKNFFDYKLGSCDSGIFSTFDKIGIDGTGILIEVTTQISKSLLIIFSFLFFTLFILVCGIIYFYLALIDERSERQNEMLNISAQVAHDIRSPLAALKMITENLSQIPEEKRILVRTSVARINDISNHLLNKGKEINRQTSSDLNKIKDGLSNSNLNIELLTPIIDSIVSEKRIQFRSMQDVDINADLCNSYGLFSKINSIELKRVISNLITNSVEAFPNGKGKVVISIQKYGENEVNIVIQDNGKGIPEHILKKLGEIGISHGKEGTQSGSGLGVYHAKKTIEESGGRFVIQSLEGQGTTITMTFQKAIAPKWFVEKIVLTPLILVTSIDDDLSIHQIWKGRFESINTSKYGIEHKTYTDGSNFKSWMTNSDNYFLLNSDRLYLVDYELLSQRATGLDLIEELGIGDKSILVTSRYDEEKIRNRCDKLGIKLIPKAMAAFVPIEILKTSSNLNKNEFSSFLSHPIKQEDKSHLIPNKNQTDLRMNGLKNECEFLSTYSSEPTPNSILKTRYDLCLIDDDKVLVQAIWSMLAKSKGHNIKMFSTPEEFQAESDSIHHETPIFIDVSLGNGVSGVDFSKVVHDMGFLNINLATGYSADSINAPSFIRQIIGKDYPDFI